MRLELRPGACVMLAAKNLSKRIEARLPTAASAGSAGEADRLVHGTGTPAFSASLALAASAAEQASGRV